MEEESIKKIKNKLFKIYYYYFLILIMIKSSYEMEFKTEDTESHKIKELEKRINEQQNIINKQKEKISKLTMRNEILRHNEYIKHKNKSILEELNKVLEICINFIKKDTIYYSIYGSFFENLFSNLSLDNTKVKIFLEQFDINKIESLCEIFYTLNYIKNKDNYNLLKVKVINDSEIYYYSMVLQLKNIDEKIEIIIHDSSFFMFLDRTSKNFKLNNSGLSLISDFKNNNFFTSDGSLEILNNLYNMTNKRIGFYYNQEMKDLKNYPITLDFIEEQNKYKSKGIKIINSFKTRIADCPVCFDNEECIILDCSHLFCTSCLSSHISNENYENKTCPLCRSDIKLK